MANGPAYLIVGKGRWGTRIHATLVGEGRRVEFASGIRKKSDETIAAYGHRMAEVFSRSTTQIAWLCVPPGSHVPPLVRAAITAGNHVIVEKPWVYSREETTEMQAAASKANLRSGVHFEYCLLSDVESWRGKYETRTDLDFRGIFNVSAADHLRILAIQNLGSHLLAIHAYAVPHCGISTIHCDYESVDQRRVWLEGSKERIAEIDFLDSKEPIIQRFLSRFEQSIFGAPFPFDFDFAQRVKENVEALTGRMASRGPQRDRH
jgi:hypothetical protein